MARVDDLDQQEGGTPPAAMKPQDLLEMLARQKAIAQPVAVWGLCRLYQVSDVWGAKVLKDVPAIHQVDTQIALKQALQNPDCESLFLPKSHIIHEAILKDLCEKSSLEKVIFVEKDA